jgi:homogentisate 1,2-dioxygenase
MLGGSLVFMIESRFLFALTEAARNTPEFQTEYIAVWSGFRKTFVGPARA